MTTSTLRTEVPFTLPVGYSDPAGVVHREGLMRLATARDEIESLRAPAVRDNDAYLSVLLVAATVTRLGTLTDVDTELIEGLYATDFDHLQRLYERLNAPADVVGTTTCPSCRHHFEVDLAEVGDGPPGE